MSDSGAEADAEFVDPVEHLRNKHKLEKKQLQSTIFNLRKTCSKKEKSTLQERITNLEKELKDKHEKELGDLRCSLANVSEKPPPSPEGLKKINPDLGTSLSNGSLNSSSVCNSEYVGDDEDDDPTSGRHQTLTTGDAVVIQKKKGKAQRRREKAEKAHQERMEKQKEQLGAVEKSNEVSEREMSEILSQLCSRSMKLVQVPADGDCFYHAIHQHLKHEHHKTNQSQNRNRNTNYCSSSNEEESSDAQLNNKVPTVADLRVAVSDFLLSREDEFSGFFDPSDNNSEAKTFREYCDKIKTNQEWAGQMELTAMSHHLNRPIEVVQATSGSMLIGGAQNNTNSSGGDTTPSQSSNAPITVVYHRHLFNLGEHYNLALPTA